MKKTITTVAIPAKQKPRTEKQVTTVTTSAAPKKKQRRRPRNRRAGNSTQSPYVMSLLDPDGVRGASIPDGISMATGTYSYVLDFQAAADASNGNLIVLFNPKMFIGNAAASVVAPTLNGLVRGSAVTNGGYGTVANPITPVTAAPDLSANVERFRVVSAELQLYSTQAPINIQGRVCSFLLPSDYDMGASNSALDFASISQLPNSVTTHLIEGGRSLYLPGGPDDLLYAPCANDYQPIHGYQYTNGSFHSTSLASGAGQTVSSGPTMGIAVNGATPSASLSGRVVANIQYIATTSNAFVNLEPVVPDPPAISTANILSSFPRKLQGFLNTHSELIHSALENVGSTLLQYGARAGTNAIAQATNAMVTQRIARMGGGQRRSLM